MNICKPKSSMISSIDFNWKKHHYITLFTLKLSNSMDCVVMENLLQIFLNLQSFSALFFVYTWPSEMCVSGAWKILSAAVEAYEKFGIISATVTCSLIVLNNVSITSDKGGLTTTYFSDIRISVIFYWESLISMYVEHLFCWDRRWSRVRSN